MMDRLGRSLLIFLAAAIGMLGVREGGAQAETMKLGHIMSSNHHVNLAAQHFAEEMRKRTNGTIEIRLFPSGQLGQEKEMFESIRLGSLEIAYISGNAIEGF